MREIEIQITYKNKMYAFEYGSEAYIFHTRIYNDMDEKYGIDVLPKYVDKVHECYLSDDNRTPLGELCDYVAEHWKLVRNMSKYKILENFYDSPYDEIALAKVVKLLGSEFILR